MSAISTPLPSAANVLVVEDEHLVALDIQRVLARLHHTAMVAYTGHQALERLTAGGVDLVLMDIKLAGSLDGIETAGLIRERYNVPLIYLTAYADQGTLARARATEPHGYVMKPFLERELEASIELALDRHTNDLLRHEEHHIQRFLAEASARMAETLDAHTLARAAGELLVPRYADWCILHVRESGDALSALTYAYPDPEPGLPREPPPILDAVRRDTACEVRTGLDDDALAALGSDHVDALRALGAHSLVCAPLAAGARTVGALAIVAGRGRPSYGPVECLFVQDFCHRLAMALDNALLYRKAERAIRIRDDVLAIVSHDLRTPLGTISMQAEMLARHPEQRGIATRIENAAQRMQRLIGDLLDASAINAGQLALQQATHPIADIVAEVVVMFRQQAEAGELTLVAKLPDRPLAVVCDRDRIVQVLANLVGNAVKFTPRRGSITIAVTDDGARLRIEVRDTGSGIPAEQVDHLFDRFWRGDKRPGGAGLGLFIARAIVAAHGGSLAVDTAVGHGSTFHFSLPVAM